MNGIKQQLVSSEEIQISIYRAVINWHNWRDCFEHQGALDKLPVFSNPERLNKFTVEYRLARWLGDESQRAKFAANVLANANFIKAIKDYDGKALDDAINEERSVNGNKQQSAISKLAAFASPSYFIAYDKYSRRGLNLLLRRNKGFRGSYAQYRLDVDKILSEEIGSSILVEMKKHGDVYINQISNQKATQLRVLDNVLMLKGGRWR